MQIGSVSRRISLTGRKLWVFEKLKKCPRPDLNWHRDLIPQRILSPVRLPIPPLGHFYRPQKQNEARMEARGGIEPPISVLQTDALPLCYRALINLDQKRERSQDPFQRHIISNQKLGSLALILFYTEGNQVRRF